MKILSAKQIREADRFTIQHEPVSSIDLMERAATACFKWIAQHFSNKNKFKIFCGTGNNGGDGLAIARMLLQNGSHVEIFIARKNNQSSDDFGINEKRLLEIKKDFVSEIKSSEDVPVIYHDEIIIDALFGSGLNKPVEGIYRQVIESINKSGARIISIDLPSGMMADESSLQNNNAVTRASYTLTFQLPKLAFFFAENADFAGDVTILPIGLDKSFIDKQESDYELVEEAGITKIIRPRKNFSHKGDYGHAAIVAGSFGKMGAAVLATKACIRTGAGLTTACIPACGYEIIQTAVPEAMVVCDSNEKIISASFKPQSFNAMGIGPGIGTGKETANALKNLIQDFRKPMVLDADALNILSENKTWLDFIPPQSIFTPHPKEFERLVGKSENHFERNKKQIEFAKRFNIVVVLKGKYTCIATPSGKCFFNPTGNAGMAKGGSGDVLTGILTGLLAQGYSSEDAAVFGVYLHGLAADIAVKETGEYSLIASDIIENLGRAFLQIRQKET